MYMANARMTSGTRPTRMLTQSAKRKVHFLPLYETVHMVK